MKTKIVIDGLPLSKKIVKLAGRFSKQFRTSYYQTTPLGENPRWLWGVSQYMKDFNIKDQEFKLGGFTFKRGA